MAEQRKLSGSDLGIGAVVLVVVFVALFLAVGALDLPLPQWLVGAVAAVIGILIWFAVLKRRNA